MAAPLTAGFSYITLSEGAQAQLQSYCDQGSLRFYGKGEAAIVADVLKRLFQVQDIRSTISLPQILIYYSFLVAYCWSVV